MYLVEIFLKSPNVPCGYIPDYKSIKTGKATRKMAEVIQLEQYPTQPLSGGGLQSFGAKYLPGVPN